MSATTKTSNVADATSVTPVVQKGKASKTKSTMTDIAESSENDARTKTKVPRLRWSEAEKRSALLQICFQAAGKNFIPDYAAIDLPGRTDKAKKHFWEDFRKGFRKQGTAVANEDGDGEGVAKAGGQVTGKGDAKVAVARGRKRKADTDSEVGAAVPKAAKKQRKPKSAVFVEEDDETEVDESKVETKVDLAVDA